MSITLLFVVARQIHIERSTLLVHYGPLCFGHVVCAASQRKDARVRTETDATTILLEVSVFHHVSRSVKYCLIAWH